MSFKAPRGGCILDLSALSRVTLLRCTDLSAARYWEIPTEVHFQFFHLLRSYKYLYYSSAWKTDNYLGIYT